MPFDKHIKITEKENRFFLKWVRKMEDHIFLGKENRNYKKFLENRLVAIYNKFMVESLSLKTYPEKTLKKFLEKFIKKNFMGDNQTVFNFVYSETKDPDPNTEHSRFLLHLIGVDGLDFPAALGNSLDVYGWSIGYRNKTNSTYGGKPCMIYTFAFEPMYPIHTDKILEYSRKIIEKYKIFYHMTFATYTDKIERNGLKPTLSRRNDFSHEDERTYLFTDKNALDTFVDLHTDKTIKKSRTNDTRNINKRLVGNTKTPADKKFQLPDNKGIVVFEVDLKRMLDDGHEIKLYHDNAYSMIDTAFYTRTMIPKNYLKRIKEEDIG